MVRLPNRATIRRDLPESLLEKLAKIKDDVTAVKDDVIKTLKNVQEIIANVKASTDAIAKGEGTVGRAIHDQKMAQDVAETVATTRAIVQDVQATMLVDLKRTTANAATASAAVPAAVDEAKGLIEDLRGTVKKADATLDPLPGILASVRRSLADVEVIVENVRTASGGFPEIARKTDRALAETNRTIEAAQRSFLLRGNLPERPAVRSEAEALPRGGAQ
jgi:ABC-type transporter Mla subunit MlaD